MNINENGRGVGAPSQLLVGLLVATFPLLVLVTGPGAGVISFASLFTAMFLWRDARAMFMRDLHATRWVLLAFLLHFLFAALGILLRPGEELSELEKPARMLFALSALLMVRAARPPAAVLWRGVAAGALAGAAFVSYQRWGLGLDRPGGLINPITFGDISLCLGMLSLAAASTVNSTRQTVWLCVGLFAALLGTIATGTRGGWFALVFAAILFTLYRRLIHRRLVTVLAAIGLGLLLASYAVPQTGMSERADDAVADIQAYFEGGSAFTNVGIRLELWKGATMLIAERPWFGHGTHAYKERMRQFVEQGRLDAVALPPTHIHNDMLQRLVTDGVLGFLAWAAILVVPFMFFAARLKRGRPSPEQVSLALAGMLLVTSYFSFGLTEVIFWSVRGALFYALMLFMLMGLSLNESDRDTA